MALAVELVPAAVEACEAIAELPADECAVDAALTEEERLLMAEEAEETEAELDATPPVALAVPLDAAAVAEEVELAEQPAVAGWRRSQPMAFCEQDAGWREHTSTEE
jgi:hypothetical protein